jgi:multiple sugar transport system substrate-binding protein
MSLSHSARRLAGVAVVSALAVAGLAACTSQSGQSDECPDGVTDITVSGPNQWTSSGSSFGPAWEDLVASFEEVEPCVSVTTNVLPLDSFYQTLSTQLAAGSATDLVFGAATHEPYMIYPLTDDLQKPNPYIEGNEKWIDAFNPEYFTVEKVANSEGNVESIPFNLVGVAVFYNEEAFAAAGIDAPPATFEEFIDACDALTDAGYTPYAMDNGATGVGWTVGALTAQFLAGDLAEEWNVYDPAGEPGTADPLAAKSIARALATGEFRADLPEVQAALEQTKRMWDHCVSPDWSGTASTSGGPVGAQQFIGGDAAMAIGTNFSVGELDGVDFEVRSMPFPTITTETSPLSPGEPARFGTGLGGTSYMIPSTIEGKNREAAIKFLQFASAPEYIEPWLEASGGIPVVNDAGIPTNVAGFLDGDWAKPFKVGYGILQMPSTTTNVNAFGGYLMGTKDLATQTADLQALYDERVLEDARNHPEWAQEEWIGN